MNNRRYCTYYIQQLLQQLTHLISTKGFKRLCYLLIGETGEWIFGRRRCGSSSCVFATHDVDTIKWARSIPRCRIMRWLLGEESVPYVPFLWWATISPIFSFFRRQYWMSQFLKFLLLLRKLFFHFCLHVETYFTVHSATNTYIHTYTNKAKRRKSVQYKYTTQYKGTGIISPSIPILPYLWLVDAD